LEVRPYRKDEFATQMAGFLRPVRQAHRE
jgi:hypothetical protein